MLSMVSFSAIPDKLPDGLDFVINHLLCQAGVGSKEEGLIHDSISADHLPDHTKSFRAILAELDEDGLPEEVPPEEHPISDFFFVQVTHEIRVSEGGHGLHSQHKAEPGTSG